MASTTAALAFCFGYAGNAGAADTSMRSVYAGRPKLQNTLAVVIAGGGPGRFKAITLVSVLAGPNADAEVAKLVRRYGAAEVKNFIITFDFALADSLRLMKDRGIVLPSAPAPDPTDGRAVSAALYQAGVDAKTGRFTVDFMLDQLVSHALHVAVMHDIDATYGVKADATYHSLLLHVMEDLKGE